MKKTARHPRSRKAAPVEAHAHLKTTRQASSDARAALYANPTLATAQANRDAATVARTAAEYCQALESSVPRKPLAPSGNRKRSR